MRLTPSQFAALIEGTLIARGGLGIQFRAPRFPDRKVDSCKTLRLMIERPRLYWARDSRYGNIPFAAY
jgi:hypothetical protein